QFCVEELGKIPRALYTPYVWRSKHDVIQLQRFEIRDEDIGSVQVIDRNIKEALNLIRMEVTSHNPVNARCRQEVCDQLGGNRYPWLVLAVLPGISEVGNDYIDVVSTCPFRSINHQQ